MKTLKTPLAKKPAPSVCSARTPRSTPPSEICRWYVYPKTPTVNEMIAEAEGALNFAGATKVRLLGGQVAELPLWEVLPSLIKSLRGSKYARGHFMVCCRHGEESVAEFNPHVEHFLHKAHALEVAKAALRPPMPVKAHIIKGSTLGAPRRRVLAAAS